MAIVKASLDAADIATIVGYFVLVMIVGIVATVRANRGTAEGFFLAGKTMTWLPIAGSIFATNMGAPTFVGLAGSAAATGFAPVMFEWHATYMLIFLGWIFVPIYIASGTTTMPEYLNKRYRSKRLQIYYACVQLFLSIISGISGEIYAGTLFINQILGWDLYLSTVLILAVTAIYTIGGGLAAVIYTDALQSIILVGGSIVLSIMSLNKISGFEGLSARFMESAAKNTFLRHAQHGNLSCGFAPPDSFHIMRGIDSAYPWPGLIFGLTLLATYFFCTNQTIVQRNLAAKSISHSKAACVLASYLKILPFFLFVCPGMISRILYPEEIACADPDVCQEICGNPGGCTNIAYPLLVLRLLPSGLRGLMLAALLAALMSSLTSLFNSSSSIFSIDIYSNIRPKATDREQVIMGRIFGLILIGLSIAWLPILQLIQGKQLWDYLQAISSYVTPPWVVVFLLGMFWKRTTEQGCWWGLMAGLVTGMSRMGVHFAYSAPRCGSPDPDVRPEVFTRVHYLHFAIILAAVTLIVVVSVSLLTKPQREEELRRVTWWTRNEELKPEESFVKNVEDKKHADSSDETEKSESTAWRIFNLMCGFSSKPNEELTEEEKAKHRKRLTDITENPFWSKICDINAIIVVALTCFIIGFYA